MPLWVLLLVLPLDAHLWAGSLSSSYLGFPKCRMGGVAFGTPFFYRISSSCSRDTLTLLCELGLAHCCIISGHRGVQDSFSFLPRGLRSLRKVDIHKEWVWLTDEKWLLETLPRTSTSIVELEVVQRVRREHCLFSGRGASHTQHSLAMPQSLTTACILGLQSLRRGESFLSNLALFSLSSDFWRANIFQKPNHVSFWVVNLVYIFIIIFYFK
jgi:hypothetical protein